ncbi:alpha/beta hydrolase [Nodosilinea sp. LEGE 07088]|uniref:alpha/beta hydrolase n=1 Tax=Nodosilinea sp. LEGE 07088 TaxID=2777968 RepID=UPI00187E9750|nr:alpha/beta hydrolase [Nodosilinea sp. LEGE 07088]MBE9137749.1 alpha/beta hydrolase [Nodosilinea sp. LEGE 07088]
MKPQQITAIALASLGLACLGASPVVAADYVRLNYRGFSRRVPVALLAVLAETGESSGTLAGLLDQAGQGPDELRSALTRELPADPVMLDRSLNSRPGEWVLDYLGESIHTGTGVADRQALRSALVLSASGDRQITLLEVLQNYPTEEVVLEGDNIQSAMTRLADLLEPLSIFL